MAFPNKPNAPQPKPQPPKPPPPRPVPNGPKPGTRESPEIKGDPPPPRR